MESDKEPPKKDKLRYNYARKHRPHDRRGPPPRKTGITSNEGRQYIGWALGYPQLHHIWGQLFGKKD
ncbi:hypothetical protein GCM10008940_17390 [Microbulbifer agarilyticus]